IGDLRLFLEPKFYPVPASTAGDTPRRTTTGGRLFVAALAVLLVAALIPAALYFRSSPQPPAPVMRFELSPPGLIGGIFVSPDGQRLAYVAQSQGNRAIWVRPIGSDAAQKLSGTDNPIGAFWSPDSHYIGFLTDGKLKKVDLSTGAVRVICDCLP